MESSNNAFPEWVRTNVMNAIEVRQLEADLAVLISQLRLLQTKLWLVSREVEL